MTLTLHNTLTRRKDPFAPIDPANVRLYVCGPTVYDLAHIGNARPVVVFDVLFRLLRAEYGAEHVTYVRNITDVDDKINAAAAANGEPIRALTERTAAAFHADMAALGALRPSIEPRATEHIAAMIDLVERLLAGGFAYEAEGHVLFSIARMPDYGRLSGRSLDEMRAGARVEIAPYKRDPGDFVLWKPSTPDLPGWDSPWGRGRPGWHLECSAMSETHLGQSFDIHGGGLDLIFPHHENEIAQSVCAHGGAPFVNYWMHNGYLTVSGEKMSKSLGNFFTVRELLEKAPGEAIRLLLLKTHYRAPLDFTFPALAEARTNLDRWYQLLKRAEEAGGAIAAPLDPAIRGFLEDDLNIPAVIGRLSQIADRGFAAAASGDTEALYQAAGELHGAGELLGILRQSPDDWFHWQPGNAPETDEAEIQTLIEQRLAARKARDFTEADRIRASLAERGITLEDKPGGITEWRRNG